MWEIIARGTRSHPRSNSERYPNMNHNKIPTKPKHKSSAQVKRLWSYVALFLCTGALASSTFYYKSLRALQKTHTSFAGDQQEVPEGIFDDEAFKDLYTEEKPQSLGRYKKIQLIDKVETDINKINTESEDKKNKRGYIASTSMIQFNLSVVTNRLDQLSARHNSKDRKLKQSEHRQVNRGVVETAGRPRTTTYAEYKERPKTAPKPKEVKQQPSQENSPSHNSITKSKIPKINILLIGNDQMNLGKGRGDVLMVLNLDPNTETLSFVSIPRDSRVFLPRHGVYKINAAYAFGGASAQALAIERFLGIPMDYIFEVSRTGFQKAIDAVDGIVVHPPFAFRTGPYSFQPEPTHTNGHKALAYVRMRYQDPEGDLGRNVRQQEVVSELLKLLPKTSIKSLNELLLQTEGHVKSNLAMNDAFKLAQKYRSTLSKQRIIKVRGHNRMRGRAAFYEVSNRERRRLHLLLR